ncbi:MAG: ROK family transcriptional regulator [Alkalispirochaeta sp.]
MHKPLRSRDVRASNENLVLNLIFQQGHASQSSVVQQTGLKAPTVFRIFSKLEEEGYIRSCSEGGCDSPGSSAAPSAASSGASGGSERKGRRPNLYCIEPSSVYAIGVDFSRLAAAVIVVNFANQVIHHRSVEISRSDDRQAVLSAVEELIAAAITESAIDPQAIVGLGLAAPGVVDTATGKVLDYRRIEGLNGYSLRDHFESRFSMPVYVHNNTSVIAASAYHYGDALEVDSLLTVLVRSGVGAALITQGDIFLNGTATALELGRVTLCPETVEGVAQDAETLEQTVAERPMLERLQKHYDVTGWEDAEEKLSPVEVSSALYRERLALGTAIRNLHHLFHPEAILLVTRFPLLSQVLGDAIRSVLPERAVIPTVYDPVQACYGATDIVFRRFFTGTRE